MSDETEGTEIEAPDETATAAAALREGGDEVAALKLELAARDRKIARQDAAIRKTELTGYKAELATEFEYADPDLITGKTKAEMRATAERLHNAVAKVIEKKGLKPAPKTEEETEAERLAKLSTDFGKPPPVATEAVTGEAPMDYSEMIARNREGKLSREEILRDLRENGAVRIARKQSSAAIRGRGEPAPTA